MLQTKGIPRLIQLETGVFGYKGRKVFSDYSAVMDGGFG
jgi:hypothetical protein